VLLRGESVVPSALRALKILDGNNPWNACVLPSFDKFIESDNQDLRSLITPPHITSTVSHDACT